jgi:hypothetical protein
LSFSNLSALLFVANSYHKPDQNQLTITIVQPECLEISSNKLISHHH